MFLIITQMMNLLARLSVPFGLALSVPTVAVACAYYYRPHSSINVFEETETSLLTKHIQRNDYILKDIEISKDRYIHTLVVSEDKHDKNKPNLVLVHGWSSGLALWGKNIDSLSDKYNIYAIDLLGFGRSSRPKFPSKATPEEAKSFWIDSIHEWKEEIFGSEKIVLLGHSLVCNIHNLFRLQG